MVPLDSAAVAVAVVQLHQGPSAALSADESIGSNRRPNRVAVAVVVAVVVVAPYSCHFPQPADSPTSPTLSSPCVVGSCPAAAVAATAGVVSVHSPPLLLLPYAPCPRSSFASAATELSST